MVRTENGVKTVVKDSSGRDRIEPDPKTLVKLTDIVSKFGLSKAGTRILLADCCRNDLATGRGRSVGAGIKTNQLPNNTAILLSCSEGERAFEAPTWKHGAFFYHVLEGMRGRAASPEGAVTVSRLNTFLEENVPRAVRDVVRTKQTPHVIINGTSLDLRIAPFKEEYDLSGGYRVVSFDRDGKFRGLRYEAGGGLSIVDVMNLQRLVGPLEKGNPLYRTSAFSPDGSLVVTDGDNFLTVHDSFTGSKVASLESTSHVMWPRFEKYGKRTAIATILNGRAVVWDFRNDKTVLGPAVEGFGYVSSILPDGRHIAVVSGNEGQSFIWDGDTGKKTVGPIKSVEAFVGVSRNGSKLITISEKNSVTIWDSTTGQSILDPLPHPSNVEHASFSPDGSLLLTVASSGSDPVDPKDPPIPRGRNAVTVWEVRTGNKIGEPLLLDGRALHASFSPDGNRIVATYSGKKGPEGKEGVVLWDFRTDKKVVASMMPWSGARAVFSPDGSLVVVSRAFTMLNYSFGDSGIFSRHQNIVLDSTTGQYKGPIEP